MNRPLVHVEPFVHLVDVSHDRALVAWGAFWFHRSDTAARWEIVDDLRPLDGERIIDKPRYSAFHRTSLADELHELGIEQIVVCGVTSNVCVESTVRHAFDSDIMPVVAADATAAATADLYRAALASFEDALAEVTDVATLTSAMAGGASASAAT